MFDYIQRLQQRPDHHKQAIAFGVALSVTGLISVAWISTFFVSFGESKVIVTKDDVEAVKSVTTKSVSPFSSVKESMAGVTESIKQLRGLIQDVNTLKYEKK